MSDVLPLVNSCDLAPEPVCRFDVHFADFLSGCLLTHLVQPAHHIQRLTPSLHLNQSLSAVFEPVLGMLPALSVWPEHVMREKRRACFVEVWWCDAGRNDDSLWSESRSSQAGRAERLVRCVHKRRWWSVGMQCCTKAVCSTYNVLCMWLVFHQHTQYSIYILSTDPALNVKLFMLSQPLYSDTEMCAWTCTCAGVFLRQIALAPPPPPLWLCSIVFW